MAQTPVNVLTSFKEIGEEFVRQYYQNFDTIARRMQVSILYHAEALLTWEGEQFQGPSKIMEKLMSLTFKNLVREVTKVDCQPVLENNAVLINIVGQIKDAEAEHDKPVGYTHTFSLKQEQPNGSIFIRNEIFTLALYNSAFA